MNRNFIFSLSDEQGINIGATGINEIKQNIRIILTTRKGTLYLDRLFGLSQDFIDAPTHQAIMKLKNETYDAIEKYEPRVTITGIEFTSDNDGALSPTVSFEIKEGILL